MLGCNSMRMVAVIAVLMLACAGYAHAAFDDVCYKNCRPPCNSLPPGLQQTGCIINCMAKCAGKQANSCNHGCLDRCTGFGNDVNKMEACFNKCDTISC